MIPQPSCEGSLKEYRRPGGIAMTYAPYQYHGPSEAVNLFL